ncbi:MAG: damage-inducible protein [Zetaproteobacteria bacterium CG2_30_46_52]|nr:MAG: damage-inducible protein [Zetaproteobacteria bacterium CG2_30_46_52]
MNKASHQHIAILIIGNEVLSGRTREANAWFAAKTLFDVGCKVSEVAIVPDIQERIVTTLNRLRKQYDAVITSGGIGPTHDDITMQCVADAFATPLLEHAETIRLMEAFYGANALNDGRRRMARLPASASPIICEKSICPGAKMDNVYVFAGVPSIFESQLHAVLTDFTNDHAYHRFEIEVNLPESLYAHGLGEIQNQFPTLEIGSYPSHCGTQPSGKICISGLDEAAIALAKATILKLIKEITNP